MASQIKVAILDDYPNIAPPHFSHLESKFTFTSFPNTLPLYNHASTTPEQKTELVERLQPFTVISSMRERTPFPEALLRELPNLKLLITTGMRNLGIDHEAARRLGIDVLGTKGEKPAEQTKAVKKEGPDSTTQHCIALLLALSKNLVADHNSIQSGGWQTGLSTGLSGKTLGVLGLGRLGVAVGKIMSQSFGMRVQAWSEHLTQEVADEKAKAAGLEVEEGEEKTFKVVSKEELFRGSDVVSLHYVLSSRSRGIVGHPELSLMKKSALFINTSRGPLVDEDALLDVLERGAIRGATLDVFELEPLPGNSRWRTTKWGEHGRSNVLLSPHTGYVEEGTMNGWYWEQARVLEAWEETGEKRNLMN